MSLKFVKEAKSKDAFSSIFLATLFNVAKNSKHIKYSNLDRRALLRPSTDVGSQLVFQFILEQIGFGLSPGHVFFLLQLYFLMTI